MSANYRNPQWLLPNCKNLKLPGTGTSVGSGLTEDRNSLYSMDFDGGTSANKIVATGEKFNFVQQTGIFSVSCWIKFDNYTSATLQSICHTDNGGKLQDGFWLFYDNRSVTGSAKRLGFYLYGGNSDASDLDLVAKENAFSDNNWHHVAVIGSSAGTYGTLTLYIDGSSVATRALLQSSLTTDTAYNDFTIGDYNSNNGFDGKIDEVAIWNSDQTSNISNIYNGGSPGNLMALSNKPYAYYPLGEQARDNTEWQFPNEVLQSHVFDFDGSNDAIIITDSASVDNILQSIGNANSYSFSFWINTTDSTSLGSPAWYSDVCILELRTQTGSGTKCPFNIGMNGGKLFFGRTPNHTTSDQFFESTTLINTGEWVHCGITINVNTLKFYINNSLDSTHTFTTATGDCSVGTTTSNIQIGARTTNSGALSAFLNGELSNLAIWNSDQSVNMANIYNNGAPQSSYTVTPTAWYKLNAATSSYDFSTSTWTITDSAGSNNGTSTTLPSTALVSSDLQFESPYSNFSLNFDGTGDKVDFGDSDVFSFGDGVTDSPLSFSVWINLATLGAPHCVINKQTSSSNGEYKIYISTAGKIYIELANNGGEANGARGIQSGTNLSIDQWYHLAFTYDGRGGSSAYDGMNLYINGSLDSSTDWSYLSYTAMNNTNADFILGDLITGGSNTYDFNGNLDEAAIFNKALTQAEVSQIYNNGYAADLTSLSPISWWRLGEDAYFVSNNITVPNQISGAPNGTGAGTQTSILVADAPGSYASGAGTNLAVEDRKGDAPESTANSLSFNMIPTNRVSYPAGYTPTQADNVYSMAFDGVNDYFDAGNPTELQFTGAFSVSFWMKGGPSGNEAMVSKDNNASNPRAFSIERTSLYSGGYFVIRDGTTAYGVFVSSSDDNYVNIGDNNWHHIVGVYTPSTSVALFIDGNFVKSNTNSIPASVNFVNDNLNIGRRPQSSGINYFNGNLDEVAIFDYALSERQIKQDVYDGTTTGKTADLNNISNLKAPVAWYRMGD